MRAFEVVESSADVPGAAAAQQFFLHLAAGRLDEARTCAASDFQWLGKRVTDVDWQSDSIRRFCLESPLKAEKPRALTPRLMALLPEWLRVVMFGPLTETDRLLFLDVSRGNATSTVVVSVGADDRVSRVIDPAELLSFVQVAQA